MSQLNDNELDQILGEIQELQHSMTVSPAPVEVAVAEPVALTMESVSELVEEAAVDPVTAQVPSMEELEAMVEQSTQESPENFEVPVTEPIAVAEMPVLEEAVAAAEPAISEADLDSRLGEESVDAPIAVQEKTPGELQIMAAVEQAEAESVNEPFLPPRTETPVEEVMMEEVLSGVHPEEGELMQTAPAATKTAAQSANVIQAFPKPKFQNPNGNQNMNLQLTYDGQVINVSFNDGFIYITMADGTEFKIPTKATQAGYGNTSQAQAS